MNTMFCYFIVTSKTAGSHWQHQNNVWIHWEVCKKLQNCEITYKKHVLHLNYSIKSMKCRKLWLMCGCEKTWHNLFKVHLITFAARSANSTNFKTGDTLISLAVPNETSFTKLLRPALRSKSQCVILDQISFLYLKAQYILNKYI